MSYGPAEMMIVSMARLLRDGELVCHGVGSILPSVAILLARRTHAPNLTHVNIGGGVNAWPAGLPRSSGAGQWLAHSAVALSNVEFYTMAMRGMIDTMFLGAVQIDAQGRANSSVIGSFHQPKVRLPGGGGAAVLMQVCRRVILWRTQHTRRVFVSHLDFVTATGNVEQVVTPFCVFGRRDGRLVLEGIHPYSSREQIQENMDFPVVIDEGCQVVPEPTEEELAALEELDPERVRDREFV